MSKSVMEYLRGDFSDLPKNVKETLMKLGLLGAAARVAPYAGAPGLAVGAGMAIAPEKVGMDPGEEEMNQGHQAMYDILRAQGKLK